MPDHTKRGAKVGPRIAMLTSQATVATHKALLGTKHKLAMLIFRAISDEISEEVDLVSHPVYKLLLDNYGESGMAYEALKFMAYNHGQLKALAGTAASAGGLLWSVSQIMNNELAPAVYSAIQENPHQIPDPGTIASMAAAGLVDGDLATATIAANGLSAGWAENLIQLALQYPAIADLLDMLRRGVITESEVGDWAQLNGIPPTIIGAWLEMRDVPLTPADAALAYLRSDITLAEGQAIAAKWGITASDFNILVANTGEPPGLEQLQEYLRRGIITEQQFTKGVLESRVRNEWLQPLLAARFEPMSVADAVNAVVQDQLPMAEGQAIAEQNGLEANHFPILYNTAGEPLSRGEMIELYNRGLISEDDVKQAIRESRVKNKYVDTAFLLAQKLPEPRMLAEAVEFGSISYADAVKYARDYGYSEQVAQVIVGMGQARKLQTYTNRVVSATESLYETNAISQQQAQEVITGLGYTEQEAQFILEATEFKQQEKIVSSAISVLRSRYLAHHISQNETSGYLDALGVPSTQRDQLMNIWTIEAQTETRTLTEAQIVKAAGESLITKDDAMTRLQNMGYNATDATLLLTM